ncbi:MAG: Ig-like domain repeat protein [Acidimicrobiia bacterium]|nr:Ig-like domain repeat protein [Acidimicrobiia bacterium]
MTSSRLVRRVVAGALLVIPSAFAGVVATAAPAHAVTGTQTVTFSATGAPQTWTVPEGVYAIQLVLDGGQGAAGSDVSGLSSGGTGGAAAEVITSVPATPGHVLTIDVGEAGHLIDGHYDGGKGGWGAYPGGDGGTAYAVAGVGGGGGGASAVLDGTDPLAVAGGGGGGGGGGASIGNDGGQGGGHTTAGSLAGGNGSGSGAGTGASLRGVGTTSGGAGAFSTEGTFGGSGGGGGGGYRGGAGGSSGAAGSGGGGGGGGAMSYVGDRAIDTQLTSAGNRGDGRITVTFPSPSIVTVAASPTSPSYGTDVTVTVTVTAPAGLASGYVILNTGVFQNTGTVCGPTAALVNGSFTCTVPASALDVGANIISAVYLPEDEIDFAGASGSAPIPVTKAATTTALSSSVNPSMPGAPVALVAKVGASTSGMKAPTGTVTFSDGSTIVCSQVAVAADLTARCTTSSLTAGTHGLVATYSGDDRYAGSASGASLQQVVLGPPVARVAAVKSVGSKATTTIDGSDSSDPQDEPLTYSWTQIGGPPAVIADPDEARTAVTAPAGPADVTLRLTVTDASGLSSTSDVVIHVRAPK